MLVLSSMSGRLKGAGLVPRIMALVAFGIVALGVSIYVLTAYQLFNNAGETARERVNSNMNVAWNLLRQKGTTFRTADGKLLVGDTAINDTFDIVDKAKQLVGGTCTIFMGDLRISTNVMKADGNRAVGTTLAKTAAYASVFERKTPFRGEVEILGEPYMTAYDPILNDAGQVIGVLYVGMKKAEFTKGAVTSLQTIALVTVVVMMLGMAVSYVIARHSIALPLGEAIGIMGKLAEGDLAITPPRIDQAKEIGEMSKALVIFKENAVARQKMEAQQRAEQETRNRRQTAIEQLTKDFNEGVQGVLHTVTGSAHALRDSARSLSGVANSTIEQTATVAAAAEQASINVETVAAAAEELASSESEIARQVARSSDVATVAGREAVRVNEVVQSLTAATNRIGDVVSLIQDIAAQTNLLALNATIEAARAGDAGKGFAVVAGEVKHLASQTARATEEISSQIEAVQMVTRDAVSAISQIGHTISEISQSTTAIASSVEEQTAATHEIARNVQQASAGTREVTSSIGQVKDGATSTGVLAKTVFGTADSLSQQSDELATEVADFLAAIKSAGDQRQFERVIVDKPVIVVIDGRRDTARLHDFSQGGGAVAPTIGGAIGSAVTIEMDGCLPIKGRIIGQDRNRTRFQFALDTATQEQLKRVVHKLAA
jgi:methyl-accepting chemotaxis protein